MSDFEFERFFGKYITVSKITNILMITIILFQTLILKSYGQENPETSTKYGFSTYQNMNFNSSDLNQLYSIGDSSSQFSYGNNFGISLGLYYEIPFRKNLSIRFKALYTYDRASIDKDIPSVMMSSGSDVPSTIRNTISADLSNVVLEPMLKFEFMKRLSLLTGVNAGIRLYNGFTHDEEIITPLSAYFPDGSQKRTITNENKPMNLSLFSQLCTGLSYEIPLNYDGTVLLSTDLVFAFGFVQIANDFTIDVNTAKLGFNLLFSTMPTLIPDTINEDHYYPVIDTVKIETASVSGPEYQAGFERTIIDTSYDKYIRNINTRTFRTDTVFLPMPVARSAIKTIDTLLKLSIAGIEDGVEYPPVIKIEEFKSLNTQPLLRYIFFDDNSGKLPERYKLLTKNQAQNSNPADFDKGPALEVYYNLLNIIGSRLKNEKKSKITITGCNSNTGNEANNKDLSMERAKSVADYLENTWGIEKNRITLNARNLPQNYSIGEDSDCIAENRRVEISSDTWDIIAPIINNDFFVQVTPPQVRFKINSDKVNKIREWELTASANKNTGKIFADTGGIPQVIDWNIGNDLKDIPNGAGSLECQAEATSDSGISVISNEQKILLKRISLKEKQILNKNDKEIDVYNLILFDYDKTSLNPENMQIVKYMNSKLKYNSIVKVEGYTDRVGDEDYNLELSKSRAKAVAKLLKASSVNVEGYGKASLLYDNSLPEGRFYCRTVRIIVESPNK